MDLQQASAEDGAMDWPR